MTGGRGNSPGGACYAILASWGRTRKESRAGNRVQARLSELLPCPYFHVVFTIPHELVPLAQANRHLFYNALFICVRETLLDVCAKAENLGARVGGMAILHTWNQKLTFHPHPLALFPVAASRRTSRAG